MKVIVVVIVVVIMVVMSVCLSTIKFAEDIRSRFAGGGCVVVVLLALLLPPLLLLPAMAPSTAVAAFAHSTKNTRWKKVTRTQMQYF